MTTKVTIRSQYQQFKQDYPLISGFLARRSPADQLKALKFLAEDLIADDDYSVFGESIMQQEELRTSLFTATECVDIDSLNEELSSFTRDDEFKALFPDIFVQEEATSLDDLNAPEGGDLNDVNSPEQQAPMEFTFNDANGFSVKGNTRAEYIKNMVDTVLARRRNGQSVHDMFNGLSEDAIMLVAGSQWDNRNNPNVSSARTVSSAKKTDYGTI